MIEKSNVKDRAKFKAKEAEYDEFLEGIESMLISKAKFYN